MTDFRGSFYRLTSRDCGRVTTHKLPGDTAKAKHSHSLNRLAYVMKVRSRMQHNQSTTPSSCSIQRDISG
jgi:hypothetical protein